MTSHKPMARARSLLDRTQIGGFGEVLHEILIREQQTSEAQAPSATAGLPDLSAPDVGCHTIYDRGALRDYAERLARASAADDTPESAGHAPDYARLRVATVQKKNAPSPPASERDKPRRFALVRRLQSQLRGVSRTRLALLGLVPLTLLVASLVLGAKQRAVPANGPPREHAPQRQPNPPRSPDSPKPQPVQPPAAATPQPLAATQARALPAASAGAMPVQPAARAAFRAAFEGRLPQAAALYEALASQGDAETFRLAARLARAGAVRKP
jgi:hypothetical protein